MDGELKDRNVEEITSIACCATYLYPKECCESIKRCFDKGEVYTFIIDFKSVEMELKQERGVVISRCSCGK